MTSLSPKVDAGQGPIVLFESSDEQMDNGVKAGRMATAKATVVKSLGNRESPLVERMSTAVFTRNPFEWNRKTGVCALASYISLGVIAPFKAVDFILEKGLGHGPIVSFVRGVLLAVAAVVRAAVFAVATVAAY